MASCAVYRSSRDGRFGLAGRHVPATVGDGRARYEEMGAEHHDHLIDLKNGKVIEFSNQEIEDLQKIIAEKLGYKLVDHRLELYCVPLGTKEKN